MRRVARRLGQVLVVAGLLALPVMAAPANAAGPESVAALAEQLSPAVVNIGTSRRVPGGGGVPFPDLPDGSPLEEFFNEHNPNDGLGEQQMQEARSLGSGFIIGADGTIVTNNHVIEGAEEIEVYLTDGTRLPAKIVGADSKTDLAVLKVEAGRDLPFVQFGDSDTAVVGDWVMAIGNPFGLGGSVTLGIVSARNRDIQSGPYDQFIQTDAAINQGNSGGPLFDMNGKVIGINTAIIARGGSSLGIGFAVPGNLAKPVIDQLAQFGETRRGWLGVGIQEVSEDIASSLGLASTAGALVIDVTKGGPSEGKVLEGDIILEFDGKPIARMRDLPRVVAETAVGKAVPVKILRDGKEQTLDITLGRLEVGEQMIANQGTTPAPQAAPPPNDPAVDETADEAAARTLSDIVGFDVAPLDDAKRSQYGIAPEQTGIVVTEVRAGSDADRKGVTAGLIVTEVNQQEIATVDQLNELVGASSEAGRPAVLFKVVDPSGAARFIAVRLG
ncbi:MAG: Do family serine endopeptidase [Devosia sp.]|uniref:Do family serine endopeptidase n=1 Tax=Devosia sp. TaxID=1871048 RepID=UPI001AD05E27|nr:Do family serine endopeptidase [Devosia sp.]MBN9309345.1 Do family serine endopeptidase [Devosia sp.]MBN9315998.1 Do family serine endopeptidase [Devosia sp.]